MSQPAPSTLLRALAPLARLRAEAERDVRRAEAEVARRKIRELPNTPRLDTAPQPAPRPVSRD